MARKRFRLIDAHSAAEARRLLSSSADAAKIHVALVDVVMESDRAGLELCDFIRENCPRSLRIILRTGQPGVAPEQKVMSDFDIDFYLAKAEATPDRLYSTVRSCVSSGQEIATILMLQDQLMRCASIFRSAGSLDNILTIVSSSLGFVAAKHNCSLVALGPDDSKAARLAGQAPIERQDEVVAALTKIRDSQVRADTWQSAAPYGLGAQWWFLVFEQALADSSAVRSQRDGGFVSKLTRFFSSEKLVTESLGALRFAVCASFPDPVPTARTLKDVLRDVQLVLANWHMAASIVMFQSQIAQLYYMRERARDIQDGAGYP